MCKPIGLEISAAPFAESTMLALSHIYEPVTEWHTGRPALKSVQGNSFAGRTKSQAPTI
jgi:hypothetical protein